MFLLSVELRALAAEVTRLTTVVARAGAVALRLRGAVARHVALLAAVVAGDGARGTLDTLLWALAAHVASLTTVVARAGVSGAVAGLRALTRHVTLFAAVVARLGTLHALLRALAAHVASLTAVIAGTNSRHGYEGKECK